MNEIHAQAAAEDAGKRLDVFLLQLPESVELGLSRSAIQKLILSGNISIRGESSCADKVKANHKVRAGEIISLVYEPQKEKPPEAEDFPLKVMYEDDDLAVIQKPEGLVVHPAPGNREHTLVNALLWRFKKLSDINPQRPGIVHRLDKDTSGILVIAKNNKSHLALSKQFAKHSIKRKYVAIVNGRVEFDQDVIEAPIARNPMKRESMSVIFHNDSRYARTSYRTLKRTDSYSMVELEPFTGRTHQLRVHMAYLGHPILGDSKYGGTRNFTRMALHAFYLGFIQPNTGKFLEFSTPIPDEFTAFMNTQLVKRQGVANTPRRVKKT